MIKPLTNEQWNAVMYSMYDSSNKSVREGHSLGSGAVQKLMRENGLRLESDES